ncbi:MAG: type III secretion system chaperone [Deltaproteobacteria bacterium]|jgi:hypothetical protein|nr:type III secretion system chaperone [Deltaproteobacteria bacterium]
MNSIEKGNLLLAALSKYLNHPVVELSEGSHSSITVGHSKITFSLSECRQYLLSQCPIASLPRDQRCSSILRQLASSNYSSSGMGGVLGLEKTTGQIWLTYRFPLEREKPESFLKCVAIQTGLAEYWLKVMITTPEFDYPMIKIILV